MESETTEPGEADGEAGSQQPETKKSGALLPRILPRRR
jgi:hypothetical protein